MRTLLAFAALALALTSHVAMADDTTFTLSPNTVKAGIAINVPADAKLLTVSMSGGGNAQLQLYLRPDNDFNVNSNLDNQASFVSSNASGTASLSIGDYSSPALHAGTWFVAAVNRSTTQTVTVTLSTNTSTNDAPDTDFEINFGAASKALEDAWGGADKLECDVAPWTDSTPLGSSTVGAFRQKLLKDAADKLSTQVHSPVPIHIQACWKEFDDSGEHAGSYTLAAATGTYIYWNTPGLPAQNTIYAMAPVARLGGTRACNMDPSVDCTVPDIVIWYNSADAAKQDYNDASDEPLIVSVTMHEITHGLGFLSDVSVSNPDDCDDPNHDKSEDCDSIGKLFTSEGKEYNDAYTANVAYAFDPEGGSDLQVVPYADLTLDQRRKALVSGQYLVWSDSVAADESDNILRTNPAPRNLVELHAPSAIQPGSTLSHLSAVHAGQLMTAVISYTFPQVLGLAEPMLERVGWNIGAAITPPVSTPVPGNWYDPEHSGHGIDLEPVSSDPENGDLYAVVFYTFGADGQSEFYFANGRFVDGHLNDGSSPAKPAAMARPVYDPAGHKSTFPVVDGSIEIDFTNAAASDPACAGHTASTLALMHWTIGSESGTWCISPAVGLERRPSGDANLNGHWYAGSKDSGWGMTLIQTTSGNSTSLVPILYYFDSDNQSRWAQAQYSSYTPGTATTLYKINGYCRACDRVATTHDAIGSVTLGLTKASQTLQSGSNTISININSGKLKFQRSNTPLMMVSIPED